jgi:hypothetical protein
MFHERGASQMDVTRWKTQAVFFPWSHVQQYIDRIDSTVYNAAIEFARAEFPDARPCPSCGRSAAELFWFSICDPEPAWDARTGRVGFLTVCEPCRVQVEFLLDRELTDMQAEQWRACRTLS